MTGSAVDLLKRVRGSRGAGTAVAVKSSSKSLLALHSYLQETHRRKAKAEKTEADMLTIISATAISLALTLLVVLKTRKTDQARVDETYGALLMVGVQIICGNCSGEGESPVRTYMDRYGNCAQCGGHSYLLASSMALNSAALRAARMVQAYSAASNGRVLPFEARTRGSRAEKIAV